MVILSDGAAQLDVFGQGSCWRHAERPLARRGPYSEEQRRAIAGVQRRMGELSQDLKAYREKPDPGPVTGLRPRLEALCAGRCGILSVDRVLPEMVLHREDWLRVLERSEVPLPNTSSERPIREYVTRRKVSGGTRSDAGRRARDTLASWKKTCCCLGANFWG